MRRTPMHLSRRDYAAAALAFALALTHPAVAHAQGAPGGQPAPPAGQPPAGQPPPDAWGGVSAGGVAPPPPLQPQEKPGDPKGQPSSAPPLSTTLDDEKGSDAERGLSWFWMETQGGYEHVGLQTFHVDGDHLAAGLVETTSNGGVLSVGLGAQIIFLTIGARGRMGFFEDWQIGRVGGEIGLKIPVGFVEPRFDLGAGYAAIASFSDGVPDEIGIHGFYARAGAGVDFYPVEVLAIGLVASFDFLGLTRPGLTPTELATLRASDPSLTDTEAATLTADGSAFGATFAVQGSVGLHF